MKSANRARPFQCGFTLIELMIVVSVIGILSAIAIPKFADLVRKSREGATLANWGAIRSALNIYYSDTEGLYPLAPHTVLTINGKYLASMPFTYVSPYHDPYNIATLVGFFGGPIDWSLVTTFDKAKWIYDSMPVDPTWGQIWIGCSHTDSKGNYWTSY